MTKINKRQENILDHYLSVREELQAIKHTFEEVEAQLKDMLSDIEGNSITWAGHTFTLVNATRRTFDTEALKNLVSVSIFKKVTQQVVNTPLIDAAVKLGEISQDTVDAVTYHSPYTQLRVK